jgi:cobyrinic acid a,c-diamide synthase
VVTIPRVVVAAPASGHGKTSVATGLLAAFAAAGLTVSGHKVGPDYIDPGYHALAASRPGRNLDPYLVGEERIPGLFRHGAETPTPADLAVIEGVMGLFDGATGTAGFASTAHVAALLQAPVVLVVDAAAQGRSVAALVRGFSSFDQSIRIGGVVLNRVGSDRHEQILREALDGIGMPVLGVLRRHEALATPARHLGLVPVAERAADAVRTVTALSDVLAHAVDLEAVLTLARSAPGLDAAAWSPAAEVGEPVPNQAVSSRPVVAVAGGAAFTFSYAETAELLAAAGAEVAVFDPLTDEALPDRSQAVVLGGGFPEVYAAQLSANEPLRKEVADLAADGRPIAAECAGLLYLARSLDGSPMCGVLDAEARMADRLALGYREAVAATHSVLTPAGRAVRGHEFHRSTCTPRAGAKPAWRHRGGGAEGFVANQVHASYLHLHWAGFPRMARRLVVASR